MSPEKEETRYCSSSMTIGHAVFITRAHMWWCDGPLVLFSSIFWLKNSRRKPNRVIQCLAPNTFPKQVITFPQKSVHSPSIRKVCQKSPFSRHDLCLENFPFHWANFATWFLDWKLLPLELFRKFICFAEVYLWHLASILCCDCWGARVQCARRALWAQQLLLLRGTHGGSTQGSVSAVSSAPEQPGYGGSISWMKPWSTRHIVRKDPGPGTKRLIGWWSGVDKCSLWCGKCQWADFVIKKFHQEWVESEY